MGATKNNGTVSFVQIHSESSGSDQQSLSECDSPADGDCDTCYDCNYNEVRED